MKAPLAEAYLLEIGAAVKYGREHKIMECGKSRYIGMDVRAAAGVPEEDWEKAMRFEKWG